MSKEIIKKRRYRKIFSVKRQCKQCGKIFNFTDYGDRNGIFCSQKCYIQWVKLFIDGYKNIKATKKIVKEK